MQILLWLVVFAVVAVILINLMASRKTKLFRRVWSSERTGGAYGGQKQAEAINGLLAEFGVNLDVDDEAVKAQLGALLAAATEFDVRHPRNAGIQVMPTLARRLSSQPKLSDRPEIVADLTAMAAIDGLALQWAAQRPISELR